MTTFKERLTLSKRDIKKMLTGEIVSHKIKFTQKGKIKIEKVYLKDMFNTEVPDAKKKEG